MTELTRLKTERHLSRYETFSRDIPELIDWLRVLVDEHGEKLTIFFDDWGAANINTYEVETDAELLARQKLRDDLDTVIALRDKALLRQLAAKFPDVNKEMAEKEAKK